MIAASDPQEYVPFGRQQIKNHPFYVEPQTHPSLPPDDSILVDRFSLVNIADSQEDEFWLVRDADCGKLEEELYVKGKIAILSKGVMNNSASSHLHTMSYSMQSPIKQALWATFHSPGRDNKSITIPSLCLLDSSKIKVYAETGEDYVCPLQFEVASAWKTSFGLLLERVSHCPSSVEESCNAFPYATFFSLIHPLNEISPMLVVKPGGQLTYMNDPCLKVVFTCGNPSICVTVDVRSGAHSIWKLRKATVKEIQLMSCNETMSSMQSYSVTNGSFNTIDNTNCSLDNSSHNEFGSLISGPLSMGKTTFFPCRSFNNGSPNASKNNSHNGTAGGSPAFHSTLINRLSGRCSPLFSKSILRSPASVDARLANSQMMTASNVQPTPIVPEICLDFVWTDQSTSRSSDGNTAAISNGPVFITSDLLGQQYLCYLVSNRTETLVCAKLSRTNVTNDIIIGSMCYIAAHDAVPIPSLNMMAVLEPNASVVLYTGPIPVGKLSLAGITSELASSSYLNASVSINSNPPSNYKRISLTGSALIGNATGFFDDRGFLSPVMDSPDLNTFRQHLPSSTPGPHITSPGSPLHSDHIKKLRDPAAFSLTVEFNNGSMFRFSLPDISSSALVEECVKVLKCILQKDDALNTLSKWYSVRNAPGTQDISPDSEWHLFIGTLLGLLGYEVDDLYIMQQQGNKDFDTPAKATKKRRASDLGSQEDWEYLIKYGSSSSILLDIPKPSNDEKSKPESPPRINTSAPLFQNIYVILFSFHLLYEEMKLNSLLSDSLPLLACLLHQLSYDLKLPLYSHHYWIDYPNTCPVNLPESQVKEESMMQAIKPAFMSLKPPCIFSQILNMVEDKNGFEQYPIINGLNNFSRKILQVIGTLKKYDLQNIIVYVSPPGAKVDILVEDVSVQTNQELPPAHAAVLLMNSLGINKETVEILPFGVGLIIADTLQTVKETPLPNWPSEVYRLIGRLDMIPSYVNSLPTATRPAPIRPRSQTTIQVSEIPLKNIYHILALRFNKDQRVEEAIRMLDSSEPVTVNITQRPEVTDHEFIEEQERHLYAISSRTLALPIGRGLMELHTEEPISSEPLYLPRICLSGRAPPRGTVVDLSHIEVVPNMTLWPLFHNGVSAGLAISPKSTITPTWISFNRPKDSENESYTEHGGFLMALGLSGHLRSFSAGNSYWVYDYLSKCHEMTSVGLLLGLAASKRGTMDVRTTKLFSVHIESLLPPTSIELDVTQNVQVASLLGIGLLYEGTGHRHIAEVLLSEIGRPPGPEMENSTDRECYSLAAGLGLGLVVLKKGSNPTGLQDLGIDDTLHHYMVGGRKRPISGSQKEKYKNPSYQIREEDRVNYNVTAPGAILALGLMYFDSGNRAVASWLESPGSEYMLGLVCPDILLLRMVARGLILWHDIVPTVEWVESHVPSTIRDYCLIKPRSDQDNIDYETVNQAYVNLISGACFALGLRFAGSANEQAYNTLNHFCQIFISLASKSISELIGKSTIETCVNVVLLSLAMVMAGTGDVEVLRLCRYLRSRVTNSVVTYGSHLATHMALGLLFLGGGGYSLSTTPNAIAALIIAFFPRFPTHSNDNRYHLQAFRHLYVLAAEPRLLLPKDIDTSQLCYANLTISFLDTKHYKNVSCQLNAPCLLPELHLLKEVHINDSRYWPVIFQRHKNWDQLEKMLHDSECVGVKLRAGCLPYVDDPHGFRTLLAKSLSTDQATAWSKTAESVLPYISDIVAVDLAKIFLENLNNVTNVGGLENQHFQWLAKIAYECVTRDKISLLKIWVNILRQLGELWKAPNSRIVWQMKLVITHGLRQTINTSSCSQLSNDVLSSPYRAMQSTHIPYDLILCFHHSLCSLIDQWQKDISLLVRSYMASSISGTDQELMKLSCFLTYYRIPSSSIWNKLSENNPNKLKLAMEFKQLGISSSAFYKIFQILQNSS